MDCDDTVDLDGSQRYGAHFKCGECHSSYRFGRDKVTGWAKLSSAEKKEYIVKNKGQGGRGKKRSLIAVTKARRYEGCMYRYTHTSKSLQFLRLTSFDSNSRSYSSFYQELRRAHLRPKHKQLKAASPRLTQALPQAYFKIFGITLGTWHYHYCLRQFSKPAVSISFET